MGTPGRDWDAPLGGQAAPDGRRRQAPPRTSAGRRRTTSRRTGTRPQAAGPPGQRPPRRAGPEGSGRAGGGRRPWLVGHVARRRAGPGRAPGGRRGWRRSGPGRDRCVRRSPLTGMRRPAGTPRPAVTARGIPRPRRAGRARLMAARSRAPVTGTRRRAGGPAVTPRAMAMARGIRRPRRAGAPPAGAGPRVPVTGTRRRAGGPGSARRRRTLRAGVSPGGRRLALAGRPGSAAMARLGPGRIIRTVTAGRGVRRRVGLRRGGRFRADGRAAGLRDGGLWRAGRREWLWADRAA